MTKSANPTHDGVPLSIALPVYNGENYLDDAIRSILGQSFGAFELIICGNASTDGTEAICGVGPNGTRVWFITAILSIWGQRLILIQGFGWRGGDTSNGPPMMIYLKTDTFWPA